MRRRTALAAALVMALGGPAAAQAQGTGTIEISPTSGPVGTTISFSGTVACNDEAAEDAEVFFLVGNFAGGSTVNPRVKVETDNATGAFSGTMAAPDPFSSADPRAPEEGVTTYPVSVRCIGPNGEHDTGAEAESVDFTYTGLTSTTSTSTSTSSSTSSTTPTSSSSTSTTRPGSTTTTRPAGVSTTTTTAPSAVTRSPAQISDSTVLPGQEVTVSGEGFAPVADLVGTLFSDPVVLGSTRSGADGRFSLTVTIPRHTSPGEHRIVVSGPGARGGRHESVVTLTVVPHGAGPLSRTGTDSLALVRTASALLLLGFMAAASARRRLAANGWQGRGPRWSGGRPRR